jgi:hypothetical protein
VPTRLPVMLREDEVAQRLRRSPADVKRLRLSGKLGYYRGRPVTIGEDDVESYVTTARVFRRFRGKPKANPSTIRNKPFQLLTMEEAAVIFECSTSTIKRLRLSGQIPYLPGRPVLIERSDLEVHFENKRLAALAKIPPAPGTPEFKDLQDRKAKERMRRRLWTKEVKRRVARIFADMKAREAND